MSNVKIGLISNPLTIISPNFVLGHSINIGALGLCIITCALGITYCRWENHKRERGDRDGRLVEGNEAWLGHRHPRFRSVAGNSHPMI